jgi:hypothetical protein
LEAVEIMRPPLKRRQHRFIYFIEAGGLERIKIGVASDLLLRFKQIRGTCPYPARMLGYLDCYEHGTLEWEIHKQFANLRTYGEWFRADPPLRDFIDREAIVPEWASGETMAGEHEQFIDMITPHDDEPIILQGKKMALYRAAQGERRAPTFKAVFEAIKALEAEGWESLNALPSPPPEDDMDAVNEVANFILARAA